MAVPKLKDPMYQQHKKYHDLGGKLRDIAQDKKSKSFQAMAKKHVDAYFKDKVDDSGEYKWKDDKEHKAFTDELWDKVADKAAKDILGLDEATIKKLKTTPTESGGNLYEKTMAAYIGSDKEGMFEQFQDVEILDADTAAKYVTETASGYIQARHSHFLRDHIKNTEDMDAVGEYVTMAKGHNKKALKGLRTRKKFKSIEDAIRHFSKVSMRIPDTYHPDKKDTHN